MRLKSLFGQGHGDQSALVWRVLSAHPGANDRLVPGSPVSVAATVGLDGE